MTHSHRGCPNCRAVGNSAGPRHTSLAIGGRCGPPTASRWPPDVRPYPQEVRLSSRRSVDFPATLPDAAPIPSHSVLGIPVAVSFIIGRRFGVTALPAAVHGTPDECQGLPAPLFASGSVHQCGSGYGYSAPNFPEQSPDRSCNRGWHLQISISLVVTPGCFQALAQAVSERVSQTIPMLSNRSICCWVRVPKVRFPFRICRWVWTQSPRLKPPSVYSAAGLSNPRAQRNKGWLLQSSGPGGGQAVFQPLKEETAVLHLFDDLKPLGDDLLPFPVGVEPLDSGGHFLLKSRYTGQAFKVVTTSRMRGVVWVPAVKARPICCL